MATQNQRDEYLKFFRHMEDEHIKDPLGGMAFDEVCWWIHNAVDVDELFTEDELHNLFPVLIQSDDEAAT